MECWRAEKKNKLTMPNIIAVLKVQSKVDFMYFIQAPNISSAKYYLALHYSKVVK